MIVLINAIPYLWSGDRDLIKIAHGHTRVDKDGRAWYWNEPTKRWRRKQEADKPHVKPKKRQTVKRGDVDAANARIAGLPMLRDEQVAAQAEVAKQQAIERFQSADLLDSESLDDFLGAMGYDEISKRVDAYDDATEGDRLLDEFLESGHDSIEEFLDNRPEHPELRPKNSKQPKFAEPSGPSSVGNNIVPARLRDRRHLMLQLQDWDLRLRSLSTEAQLRSSEFEIDELQREVEAINAEIRNSDIAKLQRMFKGRVGPEEAQLIAISKRMFELMHPRKLIRVPPGTTQAEYGAILEALNEGDRMALRQYTIPRPKGHKTAHDRKVNAKKSAKKSTKKSTKQSTKSKKMQKAVLGDRLWFVDDLRLTKASVGDTKTEGGVTYRLNENHRWEAVRQSGSEGIGGMAIIQDDSASSRPNIKRQPGALARVVPKTFKESAIADQRQAVAAKTEENLDVYVMQEVNPKAVAMVREWLSQTINQADFAQHTLRDYEQALEQLAWDVRAALEQDSDHDTHPINAEIAAKVASHFASKRHETIRKKLLRSDSFADGFSLTEADIEADVVNSAREQLNQHAQTVLKQPLRAASQKVNNFLAENLEQAIVALEANRDDPHADENYQNWLDAAQKIDFYLAHAVDLEEVEDLLSPTNKSSVLNRAILRPVRAELEFLATNGTLEFLDGFGDAAGTAASKAEDRYDKLHEAEMVAGLHRGTMKDLADLMPKLLAYVELQKQIEAADRNLALYDRDIPQLKAKVEKTRNHDDLLHLHGMQMGRIHWQGERDRMAFELEHIDLSPDWMLYDRSKRNNQEIRQALNYQPGN